MMQTTDSTAHRAAVVAAAGSGKVVDGVEVGALSGYSSDASWRGWTEQNASEQGMDAEVARGGRDEDGARA